jgi:hypothetical protein
VKLTSKSARSRAFAAVGFWVMLAAFTGSAYSALASGKGSPAHRPRTPCPRLASRHGSRFIEGHRESLSTPFLTHG